MSEMLLSVEHLFKSFQTHDNKKLEVLKGLDLDVRERESLCIVGASGAGKSTLLHILGTLDVPTKGKVFYRNEDLFLKKDKQLALFRNQKLGFVFQFHHLIPELTALENVMLPGRIAYKDLKVIESKAYELLKTLDLAHRVRHYPSQLSGGEKQRVAVARALFNEPEILLADEPTGNLDSYNSRMIEELFFEIHKMRNFALICVTHDWEFASCFSRLLNLKDGSWALS